MKYEITKEQIEILVDVSKNAETRLKEWFPEAFKTFLEVGKWYFIERCDDLFDDKQKALVFYEDKDDLYGFDHGGKWISCYGNPKNDKYTFTIATESEVFEVLKNEAVKRYKNVDIIVSFHNQKLYIKKSKTDFNYITEDNEKHFGLDGSEFVVIFDNGHWATLIETISKGEAEKLLNKKII